ncbi:hypothetical protein ACFLUB_04585, partial [Chloroflexota bacterium]
MPASQYPHRFINQYTRIPGEVSDRLDTEFGGEYEGVRHCLGLIITNLLACGTTAYSRNSSFYTENRTRHYTYTNMMRATDLAAEKGYASNNLGFRSKGYRKGISSTLSPLGKLAEDFSPTGRLETDVELLPLLVIDNRPMYTISDIASVAKVSSVPVPLLPTTYNVTYKLNREYFNRMEIDYSKLDIKEEYLTVVGLTRVFKGGEGGRWFQKGGLSYQQLSGEDRARILLDGEEVVELDYPAMHPHILYAWAGEQCPENFYERVADLCGCKRSVAKSTVLFALNAKGYASLSSAINLDKAHETRANLARKEPKPILYEELKEAGLRPSDVVNAIGEVHSAIRKYLFSGMANRLMLEESEVLTSALLRLMGLNIPSLPVHDSLIAPKRYRGQVKQVMEDA